MRQKLSLIAALLIALLSAGCPTNGVPAIDLTTVNIRDVQVEVSDGALANGVTPGSSYALTYTVTYQAEDSAIVTTTNIDRSQILAVSDDLDANGAGFDVPQNNIGHQSRDYSLTLSIPGNSYPARTLTFGTNWAGLTGFTYSGSSGSDGTSGGNGTNGRDGPAVNVHLLDARDSHGTLWDLVRIDVIRSAASNSTYLIMPHGHSLRITSRGGNGGDGGDGDDGRSRSESSSSCDEDRTRRYTEGDGEDGGNGGNGGDGGAMRLISNGLSDGIMLVSEGGRSGSRGEGGDGRSYCGDRGRDGSDGLSGRGGSDGAVTAQTASLEALYEAFDGQDLTGLTFE